MNGAQARATAPGDADAPGLAPRRAALALIAAVLDGGRSLDAAKADPAMAALSGPQRARAGDLAAATLRWLAPLDALLAGLMRQPIAPRAHVARDALRLAAAEVGALGAAPHAAVDAAVRLSKADRRAAPLAGLVNAVARRAVEAAPAHLADPAVRLTAAPDWLMRRLRAEYGPAAEAIALAQLADAAIDLTPRDPAEAALWADRLGAALTSTGSVRLPGGAQITALPGYAEGAWWAQDASAAVPARLMGAVAGRRVLDLCAAPGGKTMQLAAQGAHVTALDVSDARLERLRQNLARTGLTAEIVVADALDWRPARPFDAVLLDAPCTATGTLRRHPDIAHLRRDADLGPMVALQDRLLDAAWAMVAPGGRLAFCTCSLLPQEGEARARAFRARTPDARASPVTAAETGDPLLVSAAGHFRARPDFWPDIGGMDGFFAARFDKAG